MLLSTVSGLVSLVRSELVAWVNAFNWPLAFLALGGKKRRAGRKSDGE